MRKRNDAAASWRFKPSLNAASVDMPRSTRWLLWSPGCAWALVLGLLFFTSLLALQNPSTFLYFQF